MPSAFRILFLFTALSFLTGINVLSQERPKMVLDTSYFIPNNHDFNLIISADKGNIENVRLLLARGANINTTTYEGVTALMYAADNGDLAMSEFLIENGAETDKKPGNGITSLMSAASKNYYEVAELIASNTENPNLMDSNGVTALHHAAAYNFFEIVDMLIFYGGDPNIPDLKGNTPLITASYNNCYETIEILVRNGADVDATDNMGFTPLMTAIQENNQEIIQLFIDEGADIDYTNVSGLSPLSMAIMYQDIELAQKLFALGANLSDNKRLTSEVFQIAESNNNQDLYDLLIAQGLKPLIRPYFSKLAVGLGVDVNSTDFMNGANLGILDTKYNTGIFTGFYFRPAANRVFYSYNADTTYQYWERRYFFHAGVEKRFAVAGRGRNSNSGPVIGLSEVVTFGNYRGSKSTPGTKFITVPRLGWYYMNKYLLIQLSYEYMNLKTPEINPGRINLSAFYNFPVKRKSLTVKRISWLEQVEE